MIAFCPVCGRKLKSHFQPCGTAYGLDVTMYYCSTGGHSFEVIDDPTTGYQRIESPDTPHCRPKGAPEAAPQVRHLLTYRDDRTRGRYACCDNGLFTRQPERVTCPDCLRAMADPTP